MGINSRSTALPKEFKVFLALMKHFILIEDDLQDYRIKQLYSLTDSYPYMCIFAFKRISGLTNMMIEIKKFANFMMNVREEWKWWDMWLKQFCDEQQNDYFCPTFLPILTKYDVVDDE